MGNQGSLILQEGVNLPSCGICEVAPAAYGFLGIEVSSKLDSKLGGVAEKALDAAWKGHLAGRTRMRQGRGYLKQGSRRR